MARPIGGRPPRCTASVNPPTAQAKEEIRARLRPRLAALPLPQRDADSRQIGQRLQSAPEWARASALLGFHPLRTEPDLLPVLRAAAAEGRTVALPRWQPGTGEYEAAVLAADAPLVPGPFGVPEPPPSAPALPFEQLDLVLVPGLAFDPSGRRLGRGKGFYDRLLARAVRARRWGVAFDLQVLPRVPAEPHDLNVDVLITPERWIVAVPDAPG